MLRLIDFWMSCLLNCHNLEMQLWEVDPNKNYYIIWKQATENEETKTATVFSKWTRIKKSIHWVPIICWITWFSTEVNRQSYTTEYLSNILLTQHFFMNINTTRVETLSDGVIAIVITIMVLEFKLPSVNMNVIFLNTYRGL